MLGLVGFGRVWNFDFLGPEEEISLSTIEARLFWHREERRRIAQGGPS